MRTISFNSSTMGFSSMNSANKSAELIKALDFDACMLAINPTTCGDFENMASLWIMEGGGFAASTGGKQGCRR
jgi:hypothetical protein